MAPRRFFQQKLHRVRLLPLYIAEPLSLRVLDIQDNQGNPLILYQSEYQKLKKYLLNLQPAPLSMDDFARLGISEKLDIIAQSEVKIIKYFTPEHLRAYELDTAHSHFSLGGDVHSKAGDVLKQNGHQNCVVMHDNTIYIHPKLRSRTGDLSGEVAGSEEKTSSAENMKGKIGISHSSLAFGSEVQYAGSLVYEESRGWVLDNRTGHYGTHAFQMHIFLSRLQELGVRLQDLTVRVCVPKTGRISPADTDADYEIYYQNAAECFTRMNDVMAKMDTAIMKSRSQSARSILKLEAADSDSNSDSTGSTPTPNQLK